MTRKTLTVLAAAGAVALAGTGTATAASRTVTVDEHQNHKTVRVHVGDNVYLILHNTYWKLGTVKGSGLKPAGQPVYQGQHGTGCGAGSGCGNVHQTFRAVKAGSATLSASRTTCGEAMRCSASQSTYSVSVKIVP